jgi:DNA-binding response OmpR family regulator
MKADRLILILDDDPDLCTMIKMMLEYKGHVAIEANNEQDARKVLIEKQIDLIIMDMLLSGTDGTDVCRRLKNDEKFSHVPILMFSAHPYAKEACLKAGADEFISKPFEMNDLLGKIDDFARKTTSSGK